jgi:hypothetical protein
VLEQVAHLLCIGEVCVLVLVDFVILCFMMFCVFVCSSSDAFCVSGRVLSNVGQVEAPCGVDDAGEFFLRIASINISAVTLPVVRVLSVV